MVTIVVESYNFSEDGNLALLARTLRAASELQREDPSEREVLITDTARVEVLRPLLESYPSVRRVDATGLGYDDAKFKAVQEARGDYILFLDGDCVPQPGWLDAHVHALASGDAVATGGFTRYEGGYFAAICTLLDFGFLFPLERRSLGCYASNNSGFVRAELLAFPMCGSDLRCNCYAHAQALLIADRPVVLVREARVHHKTPDFFDERVRQGADAVVACRVNPALREAAWLQFGIAAAPLFYSLAVLRDWRRLATGYRDLELPVWFLPFAAMSFPVFRLVDLGGMVKALLR